MCCGCVYRATAQTIRGAIKQTRQQNIRIIDQIRATEGNAIDIQAMWFVAANILTW